MKNKYDFHSTTEYYREVKALVENPKQYRENMVDLQGKVDFIEKSRDSIIEYHKLLGDLKEVRGSLDYKPVFNIDQKMKELNKINKDQLNQAVGVKETQGEVADLIEGYNDIIEAVSQKFAVLDMKLTELEKN